jgi:hypothetical protein
VPAGGRAAPQAGGAREEDPKDAVGRAIERNADKK